MLIESPLTSSSSLQSKILPLFFSTPLQTRGSTCSVELIVKGKLDYEIQKSISITVRVTDIRGRSIARTFLVAVNDINDPPTVSPILLDMLSFLYSQMYISFLKFSNLFMCRVPFLNFWRNGSVTI